MAKLYRAALCGFTAVLIATAGCSGPEQGGDGPKIGITYGTIQTKLLKYRIDINGEYASALEIGRASCRERV
jgi:hypothetical protein